MFSSNMTNDPTDLASMLMFLLRTQQKTVSPGSLIVDKGEKVS